MATLLAWLAGLVLVAAGATLFIGPLRRAVVTAPLLDALRRFVPAMSATEREAIAAGTVWWDGELFSGDPDWQALLSTPAPRLRADESAFLDGPVERLCTMIDDWTITHDLEDLPPEAWSFMREQGFFGLIIPQRYGGLGFSALGHSAVVAKLTSRSISAAVTMMVPNSLGPAELLLHYGTEAQRSHYLPRLARGEEIPCFALTGPQAGSDASAIPDRGVVCMGEDPGGERILGIRLDWDKRYITLGPVATLLGLAFQLEDPDGLLGETGTPGITVALISTDRAGITIGNRHRVLDQAFMNGPNQGRGVFVPLDAIIGGPSMAGQGWRMLVESLAAGRSVSLPAMSAGSARLASRGAGAYAAIRHQFNLPVGEFGGVQEALARIGGNAYVIDAARSLTASALDLGERPSVLSAIVKYHLTERMRQVMNDAMDVHGGRGICMGSRNYLARGYQAIPIAITVEGANILTRNLIIFGQGAIRCHPHLMKALGALEAPSRADAVAQLDAVLGAHLRFTLGNGVRAFGYAFVGNLGAQDWQTDGLSAYYRRFTRMSAALAFVSDVLLMTLGGRLKRMERISARLGDVLSALYLGSAALKRFRDDGCPVTDRPLVHWACRDSLYRIQIAFDELFRNLPSPALGRLLRRVVFPLGLPYDAPNDANDRRVARLMMQPGGARDRLSAGVFVGGPGEPLGRVEHAFRLDVLARGARRKLRHAERAGQIPGGGTLAARIEQALDAAILAEPEARMLRDAEAAIAEAIAVDDFPADAFGLRAGRDTGSVTAFTDRRTGTTGVGRVEGKP